MRADLPALGRRRHAGARSRQGHTWTCWRDLLDPHLTDLLTQGVELMERDAGRARDAPGFDRAGHRDPLRPLGPPGPGVPQRAGPGVGLREQRHGRRRRATCSTPAGSSSTASTPSTSSTLVRPLAPAGGAGPAAPAPTTPGSPTRSCRWIGQDSPGRRRDAVVTGCSLGAYHALQLALTRADLFPVAICLVRQLRPVARGTPGASAATPRTSPTPPTTSRTCTATTSTGCASRLHVVLVVGQGAVGDAPDRVAAVGPPDGGAAGREGDPARARRLGPRLRPRLAVVAAPARPPPAPLLLIARPDRRG